MVSKLKTDLRKGLVVTVTGTGVSVAACGNQEIDGFKVATWTGLIAHGLKHCMDLGLVDQHELEDLESKLEATDVGAMVEVAELVTKRLMRRSRGTYLGWLKDTVGSLTPSEPEILKAIHAIPGLTATLNYDDLLEKATARVSCTWTNSEGIQGVLRREGPASILHLHGCWNEPESVVFGLGSYNQVKDHSHTQALLRHLLLGCTVLFVGCGSTFADPNFSSLIEWGKEALKDVAPRHFLLCRSSELKRFQVELAGAPWLQLVAYGDYHSDLLPFLTDLAEGTAVMGATGRGSFDLSGPQAASVSPAIAPELMSEVESIQNEKLDEIRMQIRKGLEKEAEEKLRAMPALHAWSFYSAEIKARSYRMLAELVLNRHGNVDEAKRLIALAKEVHPSGRFAFTEALIEQSLNGPEAALKLIPFPAGQHEWHLRAVLLFNAGKCDEVDALLQAPSFEPDAETYRLRALVHAAHREIDKARSAADQALEKGTEWIHVRQTSALIDYLSSLSTAFPAWNHWLWPIPVIWRYVRQTPVCTEALQRAEAGFGSIATREEKGSEAWLNIAIWQLAALANNPKERTRAEVLAREIVQFAPTWFPAIAWVLERKFAVPMSESKRLLRDQCRDSSCSLEDVRGLVGLLMADREFVEAGELLDGMRQTYLEAQADDLWMLHRVQVWLEAGEVGKAEQFASDQEAPDAELLEETISRFKAQEAGWTKDQARGLAEEFARTGTDASLFDACVAHHAAGLSEFAVEHAEELIQRFGTEAPLRLAMDAAVSIRDYKQCLYLMERFWPMVGVRELPREVRRLKGVCLREMGRLPEAEEEFRILAEQEESLQDRYALFDLQLSRGRVVEAASTARAMINDESATGELLLHVAGRLRPDNLSLARAIFDQAIRKGLNSPHAAALAIHVGFPLGLDDQLDEYLKEALGAAGTEGAAFRPFTITEFVEQQTEWNQNRAKLEARYRHGEVAVHHFAQSIGDPLVNFYHALPQLIESSAANLERSWSLRIRHGSKRQPAKFPSKAPIRVFMDITSLLLAAHLEVLEILEEHVGAIEISPWAIASLVGQIDALTSGQPSRIAPKEEVIRMLHDEAIRPIEIERLPSTELAPEFEKMGQEWCNLLHHVIHSDGILVESFPLLSNDASMTAVEIPGEQVAFLRSCRDVLSSLNAKGDLSSDEVEIAQRRLDSAGGREVVPIEFEGLGCVVLEGGLAEQLSSAGLLRPLSKRARVFIRSDEIDRLRLDLEQHSRRDKHVDWLKLLRDRLTNGLEAGIYVESPGSEVRYGKSGEEVPMVFRCVGDFLDEGRSNEVLSCCDDRMLSRLTAIGKSSVVGLFDLLWLLEGRAKLPRNKLFGYLHRLRASNVRYLPVSAVEIVHHLDRTLIERGEIVENAELATIRRYIAACWLDRSSIQLLPAGHPEALKSSEVLFISHCYHVACEALLRLWKTKDFSLERRRACSDWIVDALWIDLSAVPLFADKGAVKPNPEAIGLSETLLIFKAINLPDNRRAYLNWIASRIGMAPGRLASIGKSLKERIVSIATNARGKEREVACDLMGKLVVDLPQGIAAAAKFTKAELTCIGLRTYDVVNLRSHLFDGKHLWPVVREVFKGKPGKVVCEGSPSIAFSLSKEAANNGSALWFKADRKDLDFRLTFPAFKELMSDDPAKRRAALGKQRKRLDLGEADASRIFEEMAVTKRVDLRMRKLLEIQRNSFANQIAELTAQSRRDRRFRLHLARPRTPGALLAHLRLPKTIDAGNLPTALNDAAEVLVQDEGIQEAFERLASLPVMLPGSFQEAFGSLSQEVRSEMLSKFKTTLASPLLRFHAAILFLKGDKAEQDWSVNTLVGLLGQGADEQWQLFQAILAWSFSEMAMFEEKLPSTSPQFLAAVWIHAARLHQLFVGVPDAKGLTMRFRENTSVLPDGVFEKDDEDGVDVVDPRGFSPLRLMVSGIAARLNGANLDDEPRRILKEALESASFFGETNIVVIPLARNRIGALNALSSFALDVEISALGNELGMQESELLSSKSVRAIIGEVVSLLEADSTRAEIWVMLAMYVGTEGPLGEFHDRVANLLGRLRFSELAEPDDEQLRAIALFVFRQLSRCKVIIEHRRSLLLDLAQLLLRKRAPAVTDEAALFLGNCALLACRGDGVRSVAAEQFVELIASLCEANPEAGDSLLKPVMRILLRQPTKVHAVMWRKVVELRCLARRMESSEG